MNTVGANVNENIKRNNIFSFKGLNNYNEISDLKFRTANSR